MFGRQTTRIDLEVDTSLFTPNLNTRLFSPKKFHDYGLLKSCEICIENRPNNKIGIYFYFEYPVGINKVNLVGQFGLINKNNNICNKQRLEYAFTKNDLGNNLSANNINGRRVSRGYHEFLSRDKLEKFRLNNGAKTYKFAFEFISCTYDHQSIEWLTFELYSKLVTGTNCAASLQLTVQNLTDEIQMIKKQHQEKVEELEKKSNEKSVILIDDQPEKEEKEPKKQKISSSDEIQNLMSQIDTFIKKYNDQLDVLKICKTELTKCVEQIQTKIENDRLCSICMDKMISHVLNCGHTFCEPCLNKLQTKKCPKCRVDISTTIKIF